MGTNYIHTFCRYVCMYVCTNVRLCLCVSEYWSDFIHILYVVLSLTSHFCYTSVHSGNRDFNSVWEGCNGGLHQPPAQTGDVWLCLLHHHCKLGLAVCRNWNGSWSLHVYSCGPWGGLSDQPRAVVRDINWEQSSLPVLHVCVCYRVSIVKNQLYSFRATVLSIHMWQLSGSVLCIQVQLQNELPL